MKSKKTTWIYHLIIIIVIAGLLVLTVFNFTSHRLLVRSWMEFIDSCIFYGKSLINPDSVSKNDVSFLSFDATILNHVLPQDLESFKYNLYATFQIMFNITFFNNAIESFVSFLSLILLIFLLFLPLVLIYILYYNCVLFKANDRSVEQSSMPLRFYLAVKKIIIEPVTLFLKKLWITFKSHKFYVAIVLLIVLYNINIISFILIFLAFYLYLAFSIDFTSLYYLLCKLLICLSPLLKPVFIPGWIILILIVIYKIKISIGFARLNNFYLKNDDFIGNLGIVTGIYGVPGSGKNLLEVAIATQKEVQLRQQACTDMMEIRLEFPDFPFRSVEEEVENLRLSNKCVNKVQVKYYFKQKFKDQTKIYGYDILKMKAIHYDELKERHLVDELLDYVQLYFIYISSLACSTYSLRYDQGIQLTGRFPAMTYDFFHRDFRNDKDSIRAKIFDLNLIRLLKQVEKKKESGEDDAITLFDFGLLTLSEFGKDRGNRYTNQSRKDNDVKPSNDGTASCFGVFRHLTTVRNHQYGFVIWDEQKLSSFSGLEAAIAETNIFINKNNKECKLAIPLFFIEGTILEWGYSHFTNQVDRYIHVRNDRTLYSYFYTKIAACFANLVRKLTNTFGYRKISISLSGVNINGAQEKRGDQSFYLMHKIIYSERYQTDCYAGFFDKLKLQAKKGINQLNEYQGVVATIEELLQTNGYFAGELIQAISNYMVANASKKKMDDS